MPIALTSGSGQFKPSSTFSKYSDAADGPLQPGDVGKLLENDQSKKPYFVQDTTADGRQWWYEHKALVKALPIDSDPTYTTPPAAKSDSDDE